MLLSESLVAPLNTAWSGYHLLVVEDVLVVVLGLVVGRAAEPVVVLVVDVVRTGSLINFNLSICTRMSCLPMPRNPPTPITTPSPFPDLSSTTPLLAPTRSS